MNTFFFGAWPAAVKAEPATIAATRAAINAVRDSACMTISFVNAITESSAPSHSIDVQIPEGLAIDIQQHLHLLRAGRKIRRLVERSAARLVIADRAPVVGTVGHVDVDEALFQPGGDRRLQEDGRRQRIPDERTR